MTSRKPILLKNNIGTKFCYLQSEVTSVGGGTYLNRALDARKETGADVIVFIVPNSPNTYKILDRINKGIESLASAVKPLILPFKVIVRVGNVSPSRLNKMFDNVPWDAVKY